MPKANPIFVRYKFHEKTQGEHETFEHLVTELKLLVTVDIRTVMK